jgi:hypothetical protein
VCVCVCVCVCVWSARPAAVPSFKSSSHQPINQSVINHQINPQATSVVVAGGGEGPWPWHPRPCPSPPPWTRASSWWASHQCHALIERGLVYPPEGEYMRPLWLADVWSAWPPWIARWGAHCQRSPRPLRSTQVCPQATHLHATTHTLHTQARHTQTRASPRSPLNQDPPPPLSPPPNQLGGATRAPLQRSPRSCRPPRSPQVRCRCHSRGRSI